MDQHGCPHIQINLHQTHCVAGGFQEQVLVENRVRFEVALVCETNGPVEVEVGEGLLRHLFHGLCAEGALLDELWPEGRAAGLFEPAAEFVGGAAAAGVSPDLLTWTGAFGERVFAGGVEEGGSAVGEVGGAGDELGFHEVGETFVQPDITKVVCGHVCLLLPEQFQADEVGQFVDEDCFEQVARLGNGVAIDRRCGVIIRIDAGPKGSLFGEVLLLQEWREDDFRLNGALRDVAAEQLLHASDGVA